MKGRTVLNSLVQCKQRHLSTMHRAWFVGPIFTVGFLTVTRGGPPIISRPRLHFWRDPGSNLGGCSSPAASNEDFQKLLGRLIGHIECRATFALRNFHPLFRSGGYFSCRGSLYSKSWLFRSRVCKARHKRFETTNTRCLDSMSCAVEQTLQRPL